MQQTQILPFIKPGAMNRHHAARYLGISLRKLDEKRATGEITSKLLDGKIVIRTDELDRYLSQLEDSKVKLAENTEAVTVD